MISSFSNRQVKQVIALGRSKERSRSLLFVAEGSRMVAETPPQLVEALYFSESFSEKKESALIVEKLSAGRSLEPVLVSDAVFAKMSDTVHPQGVIAVVRQPSHALSDILDSAAGEKNSALLVLENVQDPGNIGTMLRTAEAAGVKGVLLSEGCADLFNPKIIRSTMGAIYRVPFAFYKDPAALEEAFAKRGIVSMAACLDGSDIYTEADYSGAVAILIGNEGNGLLPDTIKRAGRRVRIPMEGKTESLNAAVSAALLIYEAKRRQGR